MACGHFHFRFVRCAPRRDRRGAIIVLSAFLMVAMLGVLSFALDVGMLLVARTELQRSADAAAVAAAWDLANEDAPGRQANRARRTAAKFAASNVVLQAAPKVNRNRGNSASGDIVVGVFDDFGNPDAEIVVGRSNDFNAVKVRIRRSRQINGEVPFSFARVLGLDGRAAEAEATAAIIKRVGGFRPPESGENLPILPIAIEERSWKRLMAGHGQDNWAYEPLDGSVGSGSDGTNELILYPQSTDSSGNFGTVDIGPGSNATGHLRNQIQNGISEADLSYHGGELKLNDAGELKLGGDPGISAGMKSALEAITGETRIIPVYRSVSGGGNTAEYTIVKFVGVRIMSVRLTGGDKAVYVQPTNVILRGAIPAERSGTSDHVYSPACLVR